eukprot:5774217-Prymnesium_polylepis.1
MARMRLATGERSSSTRSAAATTARTKPTMRKMDATEAKRSCAIDSIEESGTRHVTHTIRRQSASEGMSWRPSAYRARRGVSCLITTQYETSTPNERRRSVEALSSPPARPIVCSAIVVSVCAPVSAAAATTKSSVLRRGRARVGPGDAGPAAGLGGSGGGGEDAQIREQWHEEHHEQPATDAAASEDPWQREHPGSQARVDEVGHGRAEGGASLRVDGRRYRLRVMRLARPARPSWRYLVCERRHSDRTRDHLLVVQQRLCHVVLLRPTVGLAAGTFSEPKSCVDVARLRAFSCSPSSTSYDIGGSASGSRRHVRLARVRPRTVPPVRRVTHTHTPVWPMADDVARG